MAEEEDPLVQALPPATDYLTYLTLLEYQLTPARLPLLHKLLQNETLTTNIGWDLVQLLLPMLPESQECLQDVARLGNPREVILRVSDALMKLQPEDEDEEEEPEESNDKAIEGEEKEPKGKRWKLPRYIVQFNCLMGMLSVLHSRIKTKYPSRFLATSIQAALEAYTTMPTNETTTAFLEFLRDVSPRKRPALPPRGASESTIVRVSQASAPDPEAEMSSNDSSTAEQELLKKLPQFGLIELLKSYMLSFTSATDSGMSWTVRLQEKLHPQPRMPLSLTRTDYYATVKHFKERDMIVGKITALSRDFGLDEKQLLSIVSEPAGNHPPPLDFEELPKSAEEIPLERHGSLLLLAARLASTVLFSSGQEVVRIPVFPDLARIFSNFIGNDDSPDVAMLGHPQVLLDSLLALTVVSIDRPISNPTNDEEYENFVLLLTSCTSRQAYSAVRRIPAAVVHSHPSQISRFRLIRKVLESDKLQYARDSAIGWLKDEILSVAAPTKAIAATPTEPNIFGDPHYFSVLFPLLFNPAFLETSSDNVASFIRFSQSFAPSIHAALSLYYIILSSPDLRERLQLEKTYVYFRTKFLEPLKMLLHEFESDLTRNGGDGQIEAAIGEEACQIGMARSVGLISHIIEQVEGALRDAFDLEEAALKQPTADDIAKVADIRAKTAP